MARVHATQMDIVNIGNKLRTVLRMVGNDCEYIDKNIDDNTVARELNVNPSTVARFRQKWHGPLVGSHNSSNIQRNLKAINEAILERCVSAEAHCVRLEARSSTLEQRCDALARDGDRMMHQLAEAYRQFAELREHYVKLVNQLAIEKVSPNIAHLARFETNNVGQTYKR